MCNKKRAKLGNKEQENTLNLLSLHLGEQAKIVGFANLQEGQIQKLVGLGVLPGMSIQVKQSYPAYVLCVGYTQLAVDKELAEKIIVVCE